jgi:hypothetical protein
METNRKEIEMKYRLKTEAIAMFGMGIFFMLAAFFREGNGVLVAIKWEMFVMMVLCFIASFLFQFGDEMDAKIAVKRMWKSTGMVPGEEAEKEAHHEG